MSSPILTFFEILFKPEKLGDGELPPHLRFPKNDGSKCNPGDKTLKFGDGSYTGDFPAGFGEKNSNQA
jgi:hypothetical protein